MGRTEEKTKIRHLSFINITKRKFSIQGANNGSRN